MNKEQAKLALMRGKRLTHPTFIDEWVEGHGDKYRFEDGNITTPDEFWRYRQSPAFDKDWQIVDTNDDNEGVLRRP
jgi:hypothetical protein